MKQTKIRANNIRINNNIIFPIGTALAVKKYSKKLCFGQLFSIFTAKCLWLSVLFMIPMLNGEINFDEIKLNLFFAFFMSPGDSIKNLSRLV